MDGAKYQYPPNEFRRSCEPGETLVFNGAKACPCDLASSEECRICEDRLNVSLVETQQELIQKLFFENQLLRQAVTALKGKNDGD